MGAENRKVGVVALHLLVGVAVDHRQVVVVVLLTDKSTGILAESTDFVLKGLGVPHQFGLVQHPVHRLHNLVADLYPDTDVHSAGSVGDVVLSAELLQPIRPPAASGHHRVLGVNLQVRLSIRDQHTLTDVIL